MAQILYLVREESSQSQLENGVSGVGALQTREFGYTEEKQEFSFKINAGSMRHVPTREKLLLGAAAATSGAKLIGYYPASGLSSVTVQDALDELRAQVAAGGGGTVLGSGTAGALTKWTNSTTLGNSILTESGSAIRFSGDTVANLYRSAAGILKTDGAFIATGNLSGDILNANRVYSGLFLTVTTPSNGDTENVFAATFQRNTTGAIEHSLLKAYASLNSGGSNGSETINLIEANTINTAVTGITVNLANLKYGGQEVFKVRYDGAIILNGNNGSINSSISAGGGRCEVFYNKSAGSIASPTNASSSDIVGIEFFMGYSGSSFQEGCKRQVVIDGSFTSGQNPPMRMEFYTAKANASNTLRLALMSNGNIGFHTTTQFGSGEKVFGFQDCSTVPSSNPAGGGVLYSDAGALKWRGSSGTVTTIATA